MNIGSAVKPARSKVLRLRGLPFQATERDIQDFFKTFLLTRIHICIKEGECLARIKYLKLNICELGRYLFTTILLIVTDNIYY